MDKHPAASPAGRHQAGGMKEPCDSLARLSEAISLQVSG